MGEFYLNYAEAVFNYLGSADAVSTEFTMSAREAVNVVRNRSDVQMPEVPEGLTNNQFVEKYRRERMVELAFEQHRFGMFGVGRLEILKEVLYKCKLPK